MKRNTVIVIAAVFLPMCFAALSQQHGTGELHPSNAPVAERAAEKKILAVLDRMVKSHETYLSVPIQDGKALQLLTEARDAKNVVEIGTSQGVFGPVGLSGSTEDKWALDDLRDRSPESIYGSRPFQGSWC